MKIQPVFNLSNHQKQLLAIIFTAPSTNVDGSKIVPLNNQKLLNAKDVLIKLNLIIETPQKTLVLTKKAIDLLQAHGIIDDNLQLTSFGKEILKGNFKVQEVNEGKQKNQKLTFKQFIKYFELK